MSDIVADAKTWLADQPGRVRAHGEHCHQWHTECLVARLTAEVERHRMTEEERGASVYAIARCEDITDGTCDAGDADKLRNYLDRTAPPSAS